MTSEKQEEWSPEKRAIAAQLLVEKRLEKIRQQMPPQIFEAWAMSLDLLLAPLESISHYP